MTAETRAPERMTRAELEAERAFLFASLADLEAERAAGGMDDETYQRLADDYTARAAAVVRALDELRSEIPAPAAPAPRWRTPVVVGAILVFVALAGLALWSALADRSPGRTMTGNSSGASATQDRVLLEADVAREPNNPAAHRALARYLLTQREYASALQQFDAAAALDPKDAESRAYSGWVTYLAGLNERALARIDAAIAADPQYPDAYFFRGMVRFRGLGQAEAAIPDFERYLQMAPNSPMAEQVQSVLSAARQAIATAPATVPPTTATK